MSVIPIPALNLRSPQSARGDLERAILEALIYSDIFEHPLQLNELHRYLPFPATPEEVSNSLESMREVVRERDGCYFLPGREAIVEIRRQRLAHSQRLMPRALLFGRILGMLPFIRLVALTGSLAVLNVSKDADFDYMLVTTKGRVWTARAFALLFNRLVRPFGNTICPNLIVSETALEWPLPDLYSARELCQMIPIAGFEVYENLMDANPWAREILPNAFISLRSSGEAGRRRRLLAPVQKFFESLLHGRLGDKFESWEMTRKIARFSKQPGFGEETVFNAEICQGNFHHHRRRTRDVFDENLRHHVVASEAERSEAIFSSTDGIVALPVGSSQ